MSFILANSKAYSLLLSDDEISQNLTEAADLDGILKFEQKLAQCEAKLGLIPEADHQAIAEEIASFNPDLARLANGVERDGMVVPDLVRQLRENMPESATASVHLGSTSQDAID
ncbi:MAG: 3-carboxy-cis,cis-muconate cycloisomerase, partial [Pseudomonadota bacterium]